MTQALTQAAELAKLAVIAVTVAGALSMAFLGLVLTRSKVGAADHRNTGWRQW